MLGTELSLTVVPLVQLFLVSMPHPLLCLCGAGSSPGRSAQAQRIRFSGSQLWAVRLMVASWSDPKPDSASLS